jgi:hypothetical protein
MPGKLTKDAKVQAEELRISQLTNQHTAHFKVIFSHQLESNYGFGTLHRYRQRERLDSQAVTKVLKAFGKFIDDSVRLTITEVENKYKRQPDSADGTYDPETGTEVQVEHFCLYPTGAAPNGASDSVRMHGYFRTNGGYFVVTRLDWFHTYH